MFRSRPYYIPVLSFWGWVLIKTRKPARRSVLFGVLFLGACIVKAAEYHVFCDAANVSGGDGTITNPWPSFSAIPWPVLQTMVNGGTNVTINLMRGSSWTETLVVGASGREGVPITIRAYGDGPAPRIVGGEVFTNWTLYSSSSGCVWVTPCADSITTLFRNNDLLDRGTDPLSLTNWQWCVRDGGLFLRDDFGNPDATGAVIYGLIRDRLFDCRSRQHIHVADLEIQGASGTGIYLDRVTNVTFLRCRLSKSFRHLQLQNSSNVCFTATWFGQSKISGIYVGGTNVKASFFFCLMSPGPSGGPSVEIKSTASVIDFVNCTLVGSRSRHIWNTGDNVVQIVNSILTAPAVSDTTQLGEEILSSAGRVTVAFSLIQPNGQWPEHLVNGVNLGPGCIFVSPGFVRNASKGFVCFGLDDSGSFWAFTNLVRMANAKNLKVYLALDGLQPWDFMRADLQQAILEGHDILCHTVSHCLLAESNAISIYYGGPAGSATVTVSNPWLNVELDGTNYAQLSLNSNIKGLASMISSLPGLTAYLPTTLEVNMPATCLENVAGVNIKSAAMLRWDMPVKWTNELYAWQAKIGTMFTNADGSPYASKLVAYPSGSHSEPVRQTVQAFGFKGARTTRYSASRLRNYDLFQINAAPVFLGRGPQIEFEGNVMDTQGTNHFTGFNLDYSRDAFQGTYSAVFNGTNAFARADHSHVWDFSLGDWHVAVAVKLFEPSRDQTLVYHGDGVGNYIKIGVASDGSVFLSVGQQGQEVLNLSTPKASLTPDGSWHKVKARQKFDVWRIYIDGHVRAEVVSPVRCTVNEGFVWLGCEPGTTKTTTTNHFYGALDNFSQSRHTYMNTQALMDTAAEAGFIYIPYTHGYANSPEMVEIMLEAAAEYPGNSAKFTTPSAAIEEILSGSIVVSNRWVTLTNLSPPDYRLTARSMAIGAGDPSVLIGVPNLEDLGGVRITDAHGNLLIRGPVSLGAYQLNPVLDVAVTNNVVIINWSTNLVGWQLYMTDDLSPPVRWASCTQEPECEDDRWVVRLPLRTNGQQFFRLQLK